MEEQQQSHPLRTSRCGRRRNTHSNTSKGARSVSLLTSLKEREAAIRTMQIPVVPKIPIRFERVRRTDSSIAVGPYEVVSKIGEGNGGCVFMGKHSTTEEKVAIKVIDKVDDKPLRKAMKEAGAMSQVAHPHTVELLEIVENEECICLIMQFAEGGDLFDYIREKKKLDREEAWRIFEQLVEVVSFIHDKGFIHRDIKPENVFLDKDRNVILGDWGYAAPWSVERMKRRPCGSLNYAPSEILNNKKYFGPEVDIFSLGGVLYTMLTGKFPFGYAKTKETYDRVITGAWRLDFSLTSLEIKLLDKLFAPNPLDRATMADIKKSIALRKSLEGSLPQTDLSLQSFPLPSASPLSRSLSSTSSVAPKMAAPSTSASKTQIINVKILPTSSDSPSASSSCSPHPVSPRRTTGPSLLRISFLGNFFSSKKKKTDKANTLASSRPMVATKCN